MSFQYGLIEQAHFGFMIIEQQHEITNNVAMCHEKTQGQPRHHLSPRVHTGKIV